MTFIGQIVLSFTLIVFPVSAQNENLTLILAQIVYRHGDRSPMLTFTNDEWKNYWPGIGELTEVGKRQQYELGQYFLQRYGSVFNLSTYRRQDIRVRSTDFGRTLMSAYCNLAGLFPPIGQQIWNEQIFWQPIPVHTLPPTEDYLLSDPVHCPKYDNLTATAAKNKTELTEKQKKMLTFIKNNTGDEIAISEVTFLKELFRIEEIHNLTRPDWASTLLNGEFDEEERNNDAKTMEEINHEKEINRFEGGPLLAEMITNMENKIAGNVTENIFMYSGHDTTVSRLLKALKVFNGINPGYCATVMIELYKDGNNDSFVQVWYRNVTSAAPLLLVTSNCSNPCPFGQFKVLQSDMALYDYVQECRDSSSSSSNIHIYTYTVKLVLGLCSFSLVINGFL